jgi:hypothetical protein
LSALFAHGRIVSKSREITVETERLLIIRRRYQAVEELCDGCGELALMIRPDQAAAVTGLTLRNLFSRIDEGKLHFRELPNGLVLICLNSLLEPTPKLLPQNPET